MIDQLKNMSLPLTRRQEAEDGGPHWTGQQFGNYRLVSLLGAGGYAEVYLGQHVRFKQQAAIKLLHAHLSGQEVEHFQHEAETIATLAHPAIVRIFDFDVQDGVPFLVMEYAPNGSLRQHYSRGSLLPLPQIVSFVKQMAEALQYAHEQKFIHRDVKPENMLLGRRQEVLLSDFGLAALSHNTRSLSSQGTIGTLAYMAPEQIEGHPRAASDQYALGVSVYEWLCGHRPFEGSVTEVMVQHLSMLPQPLRERVPTIPSEVEQVVLRALAKDPKARFASVRDFAAALEQASQRALSPTAQIPSEQPAAGSAAASAFATLAVPTSQPTLPVDTPAEPAVPAESPQTPPDAVWEAIPVFTPPATPLAATTPVAAAIPMPLEPSLPVRRKGLARLPALLLIGLVALVIAAGVLGSLSLLAHFGVFSAHGGPPATLARGGTWTYGLPGDVNSLIPNGDLSGTASGITDQALYLPLFYGDAQGVIHPGAATEVPSVQNGGVSADATIWTFHLRPHLVWSDGAPYDARDVDYTWRLWANPKFAAGSTLGLNLISSTEVSADHLAITFHLTRPFAPFLAALWVDGLFAPLPAHHFSSMAPDQILKSPDNLNPKVTSGPFLMAESVPGDHYTLVRNPRYYRTSEGLPYLDKVVIRVEYRLDLVLKQLQTGSLDATGHFTAVQNFQEYQRLKDYTLIYPPTQNGFEALYFNFHNTVLASHLEVRQAMAMAVDQQTIIAGALKGLGTLLCTDHPSAYHPGFDPNAPCPLFELAAANKLLDDTGWVRGPDGVRARDGQRLEFEYSSQVGLAERFGVETIIQRDFQQIGIKLDIQNYPQDTFFGSFLPQGQASPPTGAVAGRYDIAEFTNSLTYDPDDSSLFACNQFPSVANHFNGLNLDFYCNHALDALYQQELATGDPGVRQGIFGQIHQIYLADFPFIVLYGVPSFGLARKGTHNYQISPFEGETINIWQWWCDGRKC